MSLPKTQVGRLIADLAEAGVSAQLLGRVVETMMTPSYWANLPFPGQAEPPPENEQAQTELEPEPYRPPEIEAKARQFARDYGLETSERK